MQLKISSICLGLLSGLVAFFTPIYILIIIMTTLVLFDFITKIMSILKKHRCEKFKCKIYNVKSYLMKFTPLKALFYSIFIMLIYAIEISLFGVTVYITRVVASLFFMTELYSIAENLDFFFGDNIFVKAVKTLRNLVTGKLGKLVSDEKPAISEDENK